MYFKHGEKKAYCAAMWRVWHTHFLTVATFAETYSMSENHAFRILRIGRDMDNKAV
tara:strand:- start:292 stop:459 length:168 start_codon:yes stop_codon:yes gene_type:complete